MRRSSRGKSIAGYLVSGEIRRVGKKGTPLSEGLSEETEGSFI